MSYLKYLLCKFAIKHPKLFSFPTCCLLSLKIIFTCKTDKIVNLKLFRANVYSGLLVKELILTKRFLILTSIVSLLGETYRVKVNDKETVILDNACKSYDDYKLVQQIVTSSDLALVLDHIDVKLEHLNKVNVLLRTNRMLNMFGYKFYR